MRVSVIIPMYNESNIIIDTAKKLSEEMAKSFDSYEILFSDDGSLDGCGNMVKSLDLPCVRVMGYSQNQGKGCAVRTAVMEAEGDIIMFTDADLAYGTHVICEAVKTLEANTDAGILIGSRNIAQNGYEGYTFLRKLASKIYIKVLCIAGGFDLTDSQCGCKAFRRDAAKEVFSKAKVNGFAFDFEMILLAKKMGINIIEMPVKVINHRESKVHMLHDSICMLRDIRKIKKDMKREKN
jgi:dolichyl-phosphate beta-glucosyltransferase